MNWSGTFITDTTGVNVNWQWPPAGHSREWLNIYATAVAELFVLLHEVPVRVDLKQGLFTVRFDEHLVIPLTIGIVFP